MADLTFSANSTTPLDNSSIDNNLSGLKIMVVDTNTDTSYWLPLSVLDSRYIFKYKDDTTTKNLTFISGDLRLNKKLIITKNGSNPVTIEADTDSSFTYNGHDFSSVDYLKISGGIDVSDRSVFRNLAAFVSNNLSAKLSSILNGSSYAVVLVGSRAAGDSNDASNNNPLINVEYKGFGGVDDIISNRLDRGGFRSYAYDTSNITTKSSKLGVNTILKAGGTMNWVSSLLVSSNSGTGHYKFQYPYPSTNSNEEDNVLTRDANDNYYYFNRSPVSTIPSDDRLKTRVNSSDYTLDQLAAIPVFEFYYNNDASKKLHIGTSAQSLKKVEPLLVHGTESDTEYLSVEYDKLGLLALKGMQLLKSENEELRKELDELKDKLNQLINK